MLPFLNSIIICMKNHRKNLLTIIALLTITSAVYAKDIQVATFRELMDSRPASGDILQFTDNMISDATIGRNFYNLDITFAGNNYSINGRNVFGGFVLNEDSVFNRVRILNCKGQEYNRSNFAGAIYNSGGNLEITESAFSGNFTDAAGFNFGVGGAVYNLNGGEITVNSTLFENNYSNGASSYGGAVANGYQQGAKAVMTVNNSIFQNNYSYGSLIPHGGALYNNGDITVNGTKFTGNYSEGPEGAYSYGGAFTNEGTGEISDSSFSGNYATAGNYSLAYGGVISNTANLDIKNSTFEDNYAKSGTDAKTAGGSIYNSGTITIESGLFENNSAIGGAEASGGALYNETGGIMTVKDTDFNSNKVSGNDGDGGAVYNLGTLTIDGGALNGNSVSGTNSAYGGALYNGASGSATITDAILKDNGLASSSGEGGAVYNAGKLTFENSVLENNTDRNGELNDIYNDNGTIEFAGGENNTIKSGISGTGTITKTGSGVLNLGGVNKNFTGNFNVEEGTVYLIPDSSYFAAQNTVFANNINFDMQNNEINNINFGNLTLNGRTNIQADLDFNTRVMDRINASSVTGNGELFVNSLEMKGAPSGGSFSIPFADSVLKDYVDYDPVNIKTPIYNYRASYNSSSGDFDFTRESFNTAIFAPAVAAQIAGYLTQLETYKNIFANLDMVMITPPERRGSFSLENKTAFNGGQFAFSPLVMPEERAGVWIKPYTTFENVPLKNGPKVSNVSYGTLLGGESGLKKLPKGWYALYGAYAAYNGSHQSYDKNSIYNNGGLIGLDTAFYRGKFFSVWTANAGANVAEANTLDGRDEFTMLNTGIAQKTGYNFETLDRRLIIQPSLITSYSFINTFDYTTSSNVDINSDPLHAIHIEPQIKFIGNFKDYLQPYLSVSMVWNIIDDTKFRANDVYLPELSVKPFVQYGVGVQKRWGDRLTGFLEGMIRNGGRNGIALMFGFRISI